ncbi:MAG: RNA polymerase [Spirochaetae bacterium HGW-Spirochaetae-1]|jgi:RNA polymerase sigma-70 factor (ECF subfamily)|nr:MAG: RNA polymerase [Spirochaetae bacterium HGW-Spirochaetae-1]
MPVMNEREFFILVEETKSIVLAAVRKYLAKRYCHAIDDVVQETYIRVYRFMENNSYADESARNNWLYTVAKNEALRMTEKLNREEMKIRKMQVQIAGEEVRNNAPVNHDIMDMEELISRMPGKYREVFDLLLQGYTEAEIARRLSTRPGTIKSRIHRGRELLNRSFHGR